MKILRFNLLLCAIAIALAHRPASAGSFFSDFNSGLPDGTSTYGDTIISSTGGVTNSGCLYLTTNVNSLSAGFVITNDLDNGTPVVGFTASYKILIGGGSGADGVEFCFAPDVNFGTISDLGGDGTGITVWYHTFSSGSSDPAPTIVVKAGGMEIARAPINLRVNAFVDALVQWKPDGTLDVKYNGVYVITNLQTGLGPITAGHFAFGGRTGGLNDNQFIDNLSIATFTNASAFVQWFGPLGNKAPTNSPVEILLTNSLTQVNASTIALQVDGAKVSPEITANADGSTLVHYSPPSPFGVVSTHTVSLVFADNATPAPQTNNLQYSFTTYDVMVVDTNNYITVFEDGFETYAAGPLDANYPNNAGPNGGPGNPWFGPVPPNMYVTLAANGVTPHSGNRMLEGDLTAFDFDQDWANVAYRFHSGKPYNGNVMLDWWFYDAYGPGVTGFADFMALGFYNTAGTTTDYPPSSNGNLNSGVARVQRLCIGPSSDQTSQYDSSVYQVRVAGAYGGYSANTAAGWFNTPVTRAIGWHHARVVVGQALPNGTASVFYYIDDMTNSIFYNNSVTAFGINVIELNGMFNALTGYFDDVSFAVAKPPPLQVAAAGKNLILTWSGGFTLQSAPDVRGPYSDVAGANSPFSYDLTSSPQQYFRLRN